MKQLIVLFVCLVSFAACGSTQLTKEESERIKAQVNAALMSQNYTIKAEQMMPMGGKTKNLSGGYALEIHDDSAKAHLPFFGRATQVPYGGDGGIKFDEKMKGYKISQDDSNNLWYIEFQVNASDGYNYQFYITVFDNGRSSININSSQRDPISFYGALDY